MARMRRTVGGAECGRTGARPDGAGGGDAGAAVAPLFTGAILAVPTLGLPFLLAGGLKIIYDLWIFAVFRNVKPPEESR